MSFNRLKYDTCAYQHDVSESVGTLNWILDSNRFEFKANETKTITIKSGTYNLQALNKCCAPYNANITLEGGKKYYREYYVYTVSK